MLQFLFSPTKQYQFESGKLLAGGKIYVYLKDTENLATLYNGETEEYTANPIVLDANGRASVKADDTNEYRLEIYTPYDTLLYTCNAFYAGGEGGGEGTFIVRHDDTLSGNGTSQHPLSVVNIPLAVDDTMTAYEDIIDGTSALVLGVNGDWFNDTFGSALSSKVDKDEFSACCNEVKEALDNKLDSSAYDLSNYYNKQETTYLLSNYYNKQEVDDSISIINNLKQDKLEFDYNLNSAISAINGSALAGGGEDGNCPWISGAKEISSMGYLQPGQWFQAISSFTMSGAKNHFISMKGGAYTFPTTSHFYEWLNLSSYLPITSFTGYTANIDTRLDSIFNLANSAYTTAVNNFYNKLDVSAFSAWSAVQDPVLIGDANITATSSKVDSHTQWNLAVNVAPVVTDTRLIGDNCVTAHTTDTSGEWIVGLVQSAYEAIDSVGGISSDVDILKNASGSYYPLNGNPSGFLTAHQTIPSAKWEEASDVVQTNSGDWNDKLDYSAFTAYTANQDETYTLVGGAYISISSDDEQETTTISVTGVPGQSQIDVLVNTVSSYSGVWNDTTNTVQTNSAQWADNTGDTEVNNYVYNNSAINNSVNDVVTANSGNWGNGGDSYTALTSNSGNWNESTTVVQSNSGNWNDVFNLVAAYSAKWLINGDV